jgi:hypothetical protein
MLELTGMSVTCRLKQNSHISSPYCNALLKKNKLYSICPVTVSEIYGKVKWGYILLSSDVMIQNMFLGVLEIQCKAGVRRETLQN